MLILFLLVIVSPFLLLAPSALPACRPRFSAPRPPTASPGPLAFSLRSAPTEEAGPDGRRTNPNASSCLGLPRVPPHAAARQSSSAPAPPGRPIVGGLSPWRPAPPALSGGSAGGRAGPRHSPSWAAQRLAGGGVGIAGGGAAACGGAGQRRRVRRVRWAPPAGRKGASAPPEPAERDPRPRRRRLSCCLEPGPVPAGRGQWLDVPSPERPPELPAAPWGCPQPPRTYLRGCLAPRSGSVGTAWAPTPGRQRGGGGAALGLTGPPIALSLTGPPAAPSRAA